MKLHRFTQAAFAVVAALATFTTTAARSAAVTGFDDIQFWAGAGSTATNRAALVVQWNFGGASPYTPVSLVWGFGWESGAPTGLDMLTAIAAADTRLSIAEHPSFHAVFGMYYDTLGTGTGFTAGTPGDLGGPENGHSNTAGNYYQEGWFDGFWNYSLFGGNFTYDLYPGPGTGTYNVAGSVNYADVIWTIAPIGAGDRKLVNGAWDAFNFAPGFEDQIIAPPTAAAVPEPTVVALFGLGIMVILAHVKTRIHTA